MSQPSRRRILLVDDNEDFNETMASILKRWGHEVVSVLDGQAALECATTFRPETIILDIGLPGMSGYEVVKQLRTLPEFQHTQILAVSGFAGDSERMFEAGFNRHIVKPIDIEILRELFS